MNPLVIFTEGGARCGFGHVTRCSALYDEALVCGLDPRFVVNGDEEALRVIGERRVELVDWRYEAFVRTRLAPESFAVVDSYLADREVYGWISAACRRALYIDDNQRMAYPAGVVVNPSLYGHMLEYPQTPGVSYLLGPQYVILRPEFRQLLPWVLRTELQRVLVTLGGADVLNLTPRIVRVLNEHFPGLEKHVVIGPGFTNLSEIETEGNERVVLHHQPDAARMRDLMLTCDLAVSAAGQTVHELLATGLPFVAIEVVDNQRNNIQGLLRIGGTMVQVLRTEEFGESRLLTALQILMGQATPRASENALDGKGAERILAELVGPKHG